MQTLSLDWHDCLVLISLAACITGLFLLATSQQMQINESEETEHTLFKMTFTYWIVYCVAFSIQKMCLPEWETVIQSLRITAALAYFLTFACVVCLPLHRFAVRQIEE